MTFPIHPRAHGANAAAGNSSIVNVPRRHKRAAKVNAVPPPKPRPCAVRAVAEPAGVSAPPRSGGFTCAHCGAPLGAAA
jgi:hypothetical protein